LAICGRSCSGHAEARLPPTQQDDPHHPQPRLSLNQETLLFDPAVPEAGALRTVLAFPSSYSVGITSLGYQVVWATLARRIKAMEAWLADPQLMEADADAEYAAVIEIDLDAITEPILACPNDPDNVKTLSEVAGDRIDEVFIGSCMTNIGHYRAAANVLNGQGENAARLWVCPPTRMDEEKLKEEGYYAIFEAAGSRMEMPGCSLCMGNQARVEDNTTVFSTSTRNFNNRLGNGAQVYLGSAELAAVCAQLGRIPSKQDYLAIAAAKIDPYGAELYRYLNFDQIEGFEDAGRVVSAEEEAKVLAEV
jgi:aconitate hydratase 2/2-methylisocitrate dehydratase